MRTLHHAIMQAVKVVNVLHVLTKYGSSNLLHGPRMYSKLVCETEQPRRDLDNTDKGWEAVDMYEAIRLDTAGENVHQSLLIYLLSRACEA